MNKLSLIKGFIIFILVTAFISAVLVVIGNQARPISNEVVIDNIATIDRVLANMKGFFIYKTKYKETKIIPMRLPDKVYIIKKEGGRKYLIKAYLSPKGGIAYMGLKYAMKNKEENKNVLAIFEYPVGQLKIIRDNILKLDPKVYNISIADKKDLLKRLTSIEDFIARNQILAMLPFVSNDTLSMRGIPNGTPVQILVKDKGYPDRDGKNIYILLLRKDKQGYKYVGTKLDCFINTTVKGFILQCTSSRTSLKSRKLIPKINGYYTYNDIYLYQFVE